MFSFFRKLTEHNEDQPNFPLHLNIIEAELKVHIYLIDLDTQQGTLSCWSYVTDGLSKCGQKEIVLTIKRDRGEKPKDYPDEPLSFFSAVYNLAKQGQIVDVGDFTEFDSKAPFLGFVALAYAPYQVIPGVIFPRSALIALMISAEELQAIKAFGFTRVMALLGKKYRYYPCPPFSERKRSSLSFHESFEKSTLGKYFNRFFLKGVRTVMVNDKAIVVRFVPGQGKKLSDFLRQLPANSSGTTAFYFSTELDPGATGCFCWEPSQSEYQAIMPPAEDHSRLSGCFIAFIPVLGDDGVRLLEDGFVAPLTEASWLLVLDALEQEKNITIPSTNKDYLPLSIEWSKNTYSFISETAPTD